MGVNMERAGGAPNILCLAERHERPTKTPPYIN